MAKRHVKCKNCSSLKTQKKGTRNHVKRYFCKKRNTWFSKDYKQKRKPLWPDHIDGLSLRNIGIRQHKSFKQIDNIIRKELNILPDNGYLTKENIKHLSYRGVLCMDAKYVNVKGYEGYLLRIFCKEQGAI